MSSAVQSNLGVGHHAVIRQKTYIAADRIGVTRHFLIGSRRSSIAFRSNIEISVDSQRTVVNSTGRRCCNYSTCTGFFRIVRTGYLSVIYEINVFNRTVGRDIAYQTAVKVKEIFRERIIAWSEPTCIV